ncbi:MAG: hypothetical protein LC749_07920, partial [Actinobacteria bacterium]|nr:hypothetical protein [Actinomycetota bacterium]
IFAEQSTRVNCFLTSAPARLADMPACSAEAAGGPLARIVRTVARRDAAYEFLATEPSGT